MNPESKLEEAAISSELNSVSSMDQHIRMKLVNTAAEFLSSPSVQSSSMDMKLSFLKKKGLTDAEIDLAVKQSDARLMAIKDGNAGMLPVPSNQIVPAYYVPSRWTMFRDIANSAILLGGLVYGAYWTYTNVIIPYFYGKKDKRDLQSELSEHLSNVSTSLSKLREDVEKLSDSRTDNIQKDINELKSEVSSLKKLLLNRKQFPIAGNGQIGIPSWQISENDEKHNNEEEGNGSNGSESSLEMIKE